MAEAHPRLALERHGRFAALVLAAPPRNATDRALFQELSVLTREVLPGLDVDGLVVRGAGRHFSSGADLDELRRSGASADIEPALLADAQALHEIESLPYPTVAAIDGACLGSGLELALACRFRLATPSALLGLPESTFGLLPGCGGTVRLTEVVGAQKAIELVLTGALLGAEDARSAGLVDALVPRSELQAAAERLCARARA